MGVSGRHRITHERIVVRMRDMWGNVGVVVLCVTVMLCGCGTFSTPEPSQEEAGETQAEEIYVEKGVSPFPGHDIWPDESIRSVSFVMGNDGKMSHFVLHSGEADGGKAAYGKLVLNDGEWVKEEISWQDAFDTMFEGKNVELQECYYSGDGWLYLYVMELSMSPEQQESYEREKKEEEDAAPYYDINLHNRLLRVEEKSGRITEMSIPEEPVSEVYGKDVPYGVRAGMAPERFAFFEDGNVFITNDGNISGVYSLPDGTLKNNNDIHDRASDVYAGDEFYCYTSVDQKNQKISVKIFSEEGDLLNTIPTDVQFEPKGRTNISLGTKGATILMACEQGIFEAQWDAEKFENKAGYEKDNLYYLSPFSYHVLPGVYKGGEEDYYTKMFQYDPDTVYYGDDSLEVIGYYSRQKSQ